MPNVRMERVDSEIQKHVAATIDALVRDSGLNFMITVQQVKTTPDLLLSTIYVSVFGGDSAEAIKYLTNNKGKIRNGLAHQIRLKTIPDLVFKLDTLYDYANHMNELFDSIKEDK